MQLKQIPRDALLKPLQAVSGIVERRHTLPILANVLLEHSDGRLFVTATDLEMQITAHSELAGKETQATTVAARKLQDLLRALPDDAVLTHRRQRQPDDAPRGTVAVQPAGAVGGRLPAHRRGPGPGAGAHVAATRIPRSPEVGGVRDGAAGHPLLPQRHAAGDRQGFAAGRCHRWPPPVVGEHRGRGRLSAAGSDPAAQDGARTVQAARRFRRSADARHPREPGPVPLREHRAREQGGRRQVSRLQPRDPDGQHQADRIRRAPSSWRRCSGRPSCRTRSSAACASCSATIS